MPARNRTPLPIGTQLGIFEVVSLPFPLLVPGRSGQSQMRNRYFVRLRCTGPDCEWEDDVREDDLERRKTAACGFCYISLDVDPEARIHVERTWKGRQQTYDRYRYHGKSYDRLHRIWANMRERCSNPTSEKWKRYGGRGITVDPSWENFRAFEAWALENGYANGLTIDRINNDRGYEPGNCRWVTDLENLLNRARYLPTPLHEALEARAAVNDVDTYSVIRAALEALRDEREQIS